MQYKKYFVRFDKKKESRAGGYRALFVCTKDSRAVGEKHATYGAKLVTQHKNHRKVRIFYIFT